jgi:hypothetical protein
MFRSNVNEGTGGNGIRFERAQRIYSGNTSIINLRTQRLRSEFLQQYKHDFNCTNNGIDSAAGERRAEAAGTRTSAEAGTHSGAEAGTHSGRFTATAFGVRAAVCD